MTFREKWLAAVGQKNSVLCAGLDPAEFEMDRGEEGLPDMIHKEEWAFRYIDAVSPFVAALKLNINYWKNQYDMAAVENIVGYASSLDIVVIDDSKLADIGSTNDAGLYHAKQKGFDAVTIAPFAGNLREVAEQAKKRDIGIISMCLMSNPEYEREKNSKIPIEEDDVYSLRDVIEIEGSRHVRRYLQLAHDAVKYKVDGLVIGAPSKNNNITEEEIEKVLQYSSYRTLVLLPGVGAQGGEASAIWKYFEKNNVIVNVGRGLMFPNGSNSTPEEQAEAARHYQKILNELR